MSDKRNRICYHSTVSQHSTLAVDLDVTSRLGFDGLEASSTKVRAFLEADHSVDDLISAFRDVDTPGIGFLLDIERQGSDRGALMAEAEGLFSIASTIGAGGVQILTGPVNVQSVLDFRAGVDSGRYRGTLGLSDAEQSTLTARNVRDLAVLAARYGLLLYLEALAWTPLNTIDKQVGLIQSAG